MALINQNSIIGVTSITSPSANNVLTVHTYDTTERLRVTANGVSFSGTNASLDTSGNATFNGDVSIGGTLTYEDVTNIDSVGIVTAQSGIHVTGGSVGIGTNNPNASLHVEKDGTSQVLARFESNMGTNNNRSISISSPTSDSGSEPFIFNTGNAYQFQTDDQVGLHINYNRKIGIGTNIPSQLLHLHADSEHQILLKRGGQYPSECKFSNSGNLLTISNNVNGIHFDVGSSSLETAMYIEDGGNIGIGTDNPGTKLDVAGEIRASGIALTDSYPTIPTSLNLNFARSRSLDSRITFTRGSVATHVGPDGLIITDGDDEPRFDHNPATGESLGLMIEEARTNIMVYSVIGTGWNTGTGVNLTSNTTETTAPDGTNTAAKYVADSGTSSWVSTYNTGNTISVVNGTAYTFSVWAKPTHSDYTEFALLGDVRDGGGTDFTVVFDLSGDGSVTTNTSVDSHSIEKYPNGWYRCIVTETSTSTTTEEPGFRAYNNGDGTKGFYTWGYQVEAGAFATSYIPTSGSAVTRLAENAEIMYDGWYDNSSSVKPSTFVGKFQTHNLGATRMVAEGSNGSTLKDFSMNTLAGSSNFQFVHRYTATDSYDSTIGSGITVNTPVTFAFSYDGTGGDITGSANSSTPNVGTDDLGTTSQAGGDRMRIGSRGNNSLYLNGTISELRYYKFKATSDQLLLLQ